MARIGLISDLHVDHHPEVVSLVATAARMRSLDLLVVAGDLTPKLATLQSALRELRAAVPRLAWVPGNHDLWCTEPGPDSRERYLEAFAGLVDGVEYLPAGPIRVGEVSVVGQTGWYDHSLADPALEVPAEAYREGKYGLLSWNDRRFVRWPGLDDGERTAWMIERLAADLARVPDGATTLVVTHMLPFAEMVVRRPLPWGFVGGFLGAAGLGDAIRAAKPRLRIERVWAGHTHFRVAVDVDGLSCETSPVGYPREVTRQNPDLTTHVAERLRVVEIGADHFPPP